MKFVKGRGYEAYYRKEDRKEHKKEPKAKEVAAAEEQHEAPVPLVTHVSSNSISIFSNDEVYGNNQQFYNSNGLNAHKLYISNNFSRAISE